CVTALLLRYCFVFVFFFFSSRRRHTRFSRDWSSDVCSSDLVLLPSHQVPPDTNANSFRNLAYPLDWEAIFNYVGWPAFFKPFAGGGWKNVYRLHNPEEFYRAYSETGQDRKSVV